MISSLPPGYQGQGAGRLHPLAIRTRTRLRPPALQLQERQQSGYRHRGRLRQADQDLPARSRRQTERRRLYVDVCRQTVFDATIPYDLRFFELLNRIEQYRTMADAGQGDDRSMLKSFGIEQGKPFHTGLHKLTEILNEAAPRSSRRARPAL